MPARGSNNYQRQYPIHVKPGVQIMERFDKSGGSISRFVVQLQQLADTSRGIWKTFAQIDHDPRSPGGHNLYNEGIHVDIYHHDGTVSTINPPQLSRLPHPPGRLLRGSRRYLIDNVDYFEQAASGRIGLSSPPRFP